ncbi:hypothetical protein CRG98_039064 [Punica granatum]|uniref:Uncharacterized protein n=1 Tax=Punica granatum TaxID=22663 RepID=A0A2I0I974_PUNGR|nr:hypothetical protein CRG98_039064 [Punica granatum]
MRDCSIKETPFRTTEKEKEEEESRCDLRDYFENSLHLRSECVDYRDNHLLRGQLAVRVDWSAVTSPADSVSGSGSKANKPTIGVKDPRP